MIDYRYKDAAPLKAFLEREFPDLHNHDCNIENGWDVITEVTGSPKISFYRGFKRGEFTATFVDKVICRLGHHPFEVYGEDWWEL